MRKELENMKPVVTVGIILLGLIFAANTFAAEVIQGECMEFNSETKIIKVREYDTNFSQNKYGNPTSIESEFDVSTAKIGANPAPGDIVRIAYKIEGNKKIAIKVMDVTKQDLMKK
jgi:hypothetical protein